MALNIISTAVMVRLGKVFGNRMVDVSASNSKLVDRSLRILRDLAGLDRESGLALLEQTGGSVKLALMMAATGLDRSAATERLQEHRQQLRAALEASGVSLLQA